MSERRLRKSLGRAFGDGHLELHLFAVADEIDRGARADRSGGDRLENDTS